MLEKKERPLFILRDFYVLSLLTSFHRLCFFCLFTCFLFSRAVINSGFPCQLYFTLVAVCHSTEAAHEVGALPINGLHGEVPSVRYYKVVEKFM